MREWGSKIVIDLAWQQHTILEPDITNGIDYIHNNQWSHVIHPCHTPSMRYVCTRARIHVSCALECLSAGKFCVCTLAIGNSVQPVWALGLKRSGVYYKGFVGTYTWGTLTMYYHHLWYQDFKEVSGNHSSPRQQWHQHQRRKWHISCKLISR